jgi:glycosyltransferase involved in cell wall biosynthesis
MEGEGSDRRLRIAVLADFDSVHARSWLRWFAERGHDVHAISYYPPEHALDGVTPHVLRARGTDRPATARKGSTAIRGNAAMVVRRLPAGAVRIVQAMRYRRAGLGRVVRAIAPDVLHAHYLVEHGLYGMVARFRPYVVSCWGSDVLVEPERDLISRRIAKWTIARSDLLTSNNRYMAGRLVALGAPRDRVEVVTLGADAYFLEDGERSVNARDDDAAPVVLSTRAHEPLYNIDEIIDAFATVRRAVPAARLVVAHGGSLTAQLRARAAALGDAVEFAGTVDRERLRALMHNAHVFVSVPSSDGTSVALLQAMAAGCFPIVSDLPTQGELVDDGASGFRVPPHRPDVLAARIEQALGDAALRRRAVELNRALVRERGLNEHEMARMEALYYRLVARGRAMEAGR